MLGVAVWGCHLFARTVAVKGGTLKREKSWRGAGGEGAANPPPMHSFVDCCCCCLFARAVVVREGKLKKSKSWREVHSLVDCCCCCCCCRAWCCCLGLSSFCEDYGGERRQA